MSERERERERDMEVLRWARSPSLNGLRMSWIKHGRCSSSSSSHGWKPCCDLRPRLHFTAASKQQPQPKPRSSSSSSSSKRKTPPSTPHRPSSSSPRNKSGKSRDELKEVLAEPQIPLFHQLLKPPAGFILNEEGQVVLMAPQSKRLVTMVEKETGRSLECLIRRTFSSSKGKQCFILLPLDTPLQILKVEEKMRALNELTEDELQGVLPTAAYALAKKRLHLVVSGFCLTARGGFCFTEEDVMDLETEYSEGLTGSLAEGVEITNFKVGYNNYLIYTPFDPVMFVAVKDEETRDIMIADDKLMEDRTVLDAIDEENEFQDMVEEEEAINQTLRQSLQSSVQGNK